jgi:hypothetical protein
MNFLERSAMKRADKQLRHLMEPGERVIEFDIGRTPSGHQVHCIASSTALYVVAPGSPPARAAYSEIEKVETSGSLLAFRLISGALLVVDFGRAGGRGLTDVVATQVAAAERRCRKVHCRFGQRGATFFVVPGPDGEKVESWRYDDDTPDDLHTSMLAEQALGQLEASLGLKPTFNSQASDEDFFVWTPELRKVG